MSRLIDAVGVQTELARARDALLGLQDYDTARAYMNAIALIENAPTANVARVVKCIDCKHYNFLDCRCRHVAFWGQFRKEDFWCAYGETGEAKK